MEKIIICETENYNLAEEKIQKVNYKMYLLIQIIKTLNITLLQNEWLQN